MPSGPAIVAVAATVASVGTVLALTMAPSATSNTAIGSVSFTPQCNPYSVDNPIPLVGTPFNLDVCISDRGTGTTAYPELNFKQVGTPGSCSVVIEIWNDTGQLEGTPKQVDCQTGFVDGNPFTPTDASVSVHTFARLVIDGQRIYLGNQQGDSPSITVQPFVSTRPTTSATSSTATGSRPRPVPPIPPIDTRHNNNANCLDPANRPPGEQPNGVGWILNTTNPVSQRNLTTTPNDPTTRAEQATACLANPVAAGQPAQQLDIAGWQDARVVANKWGMILPGQSIARCHLIADVLGGQGFAQNLVPCWQILVNIAGGSSMRDQEAMAQARLAPGGLAPGQAIFYQTTPNYKDSQSTIPTSIHMAAQIEDIDGTVLETLFDIDIPNQTYVDGAVVPLGN
jgi:hypothetical protein